MANPEGEPEDLWRAESPLMRGLFAEGGILRVRALLALIFVVTGAVGALTGRLDTELALIIMFSGAMPYGISRAGK